jgi:hypothetical protein
MQGTVAKTNLIKKNVAIRQIRNILGAVKSTSTQHLAELWEPETVSRPEWIFKKFAIS